MKNLKVASPRLSIGMVVVALICLLAGAVSAEPWKFALMGDCRGLKSGEGSKDGVRVSVLGPLAADAAKAGVNLVIFSGDLVNGGVSCGSLTTQLTAWKEAMAPIYDARIPVYPCRGNHETHQGGASGEALKAWRSFFPELPQNGPAGEEGLTYKVEYANATFIGFDQFIGVHSNGAGLIPGSRATKSGMMSPWVVGQVNAAKTPWLFVFGHEMAFPGHHTDCLADVPAERNALWDALGAKGGIYLSGHDHLYVRRTALDSAHRPVLELVLGCTGAPLYPYDDSLDPPTNNEPYVPTEQFINAKVQADGTKASKKNTHDYPQYFGYILVTIDGGKLTGEWRALTNYDLKNWSLEGAPKFETLDTFTLAR